MKNIIFPALLTSTSFSVKINLLPNKCLSQSKWPETKLLNTTWQQWTEPFLMNFPDNLVEPPDDSIICAFKWINKTELSYIVKNVPGVKKYRVDFEISYDFSEIDLKNTSVSKFPDAKCIRVLIFGDVLMFTHGTLF